VVERSAKSAERNPRRPRIPSDERGPCVRRRFVLRFRILMFFVARARTARALDFDAVPNVLKIFFIYSFIPQHTV
jgi:hypothetical protein